MTENYTAPHGPAPSSGPMAPPWRLVRSEEDVLAGVCGGLAAASGIDVTLVRLAFVAAGLSGFGIIAYIILALVVPRQNVAAGEMLRPAPGETQRWIRIAVVVGGIAGLLGFLSDGWGWGWGPGRGVDDGFAFGLILIAIGVGIVWLRRGRPTPGFLGGATPATAGSAPLAPRTTGSWAPPAPGAAWTGPEHTTGLAGGDTLTGEAIGTDGTTTLPLTGDSTPPFTDGGSTPPFTDGGSTPPFTDGGSTPPFTDGGSTPPPGRVDYGQRRRTPGSAIVARVFGWLTVLIAIPITVATAAADDIDAISIPWSGLFLALAIAGILHLVAWSSIARSAGPVLISIGLLVALGSVVIGVTHVNGKIGEDVAEPVVRTELKTVYELAIGHQVVDLTELDAGGDAVTITVEQGIGLTEIVVPDDATVTTNADVRAGSIVVFGDEDNGWNAGVRDVSEGTGDTYDLDLEMGFGRIEVCRASDSRTVGDHLECTVGG